MNRVDRLMSMILTIQSKKFVQAEALAEKYGLTLRTIYRDIKSLNEIGVPIYYEHNKGYAILDKHFLPPLLFTREEANSLLLLQTLAEKFADKSIISGSASALEKVKSVLRHRDWERLDKLASKIEVHVPPEASVVKDHLTEIQNAIIDKHVLTIGYSDNSDSQTQRKIEPIGLIFYTEQWHLIAWCQLRQSYRDFKVNKIQRLFVTTETFSREHTYSIQEYMKIF